jgi:exodeoxyribonuclease VII large subunit
LAKGFVRVTDREGRTLTHAADAIAARALTLHFGDGRVDATTGDEGKRPTSPRLERGRPRPYVAPQRGLFDEPED